MIEAKIDGIFRLRSKVIRVKAIATVLSVFVLLSEASAELQGQDRRQNRRSEATERFPDLEKALQNPLARVAEFSTDFQYSYGGGPGGVGDSYLMRFDPRIPFSLGDNWHLISKTNLAWAHQYDFVPGTRQSGWSDIGQSFFLSPDRSIGWDTYWGAGASAVIPTDSADFIGNDHWRLGPAFGFFRQKRESWTAGFLTSHLWSVGGGGDSPEISQTLLQPIFAYTTDNSTTLALRANLTYDWKESAWFGPVELRISQLTILWDRPVQFSLGLQGFVLDESDTAPDWGCLFRVAIPLKLNL